MQSPDPASVQAFLWLTLLAQAAGLVFVLTWGARSRRRTGPALHAVRRRVRPRLAMIAGVAATGLVVVLGRGEVALGPALAVLGLAAALLALQPGFLDSVCGEDGLRLGWHARRYDQLEEWRLTGDHLRWKLRGTWVACDAPARLHADLRARLERLCPERESIFRA